MRAFGLVISVLALASAHPHAQAASGINTNAITVTPELINRLVAEMRTNHLALRSAIARVRAAEAGVRAVRTWEDPMLKLGGMAADTMMRAQEGDLIYGVDQKLPLFGKPRLAREAGRAAVATEQASAEYQFQTLRRELAKTLFRAAFADRVVQIGDEDRVWLETMVRATAAKYRTDEATLAELLELQNRLAERTNQLRTDITLRDNERFGLNRLLNRDLHAPWPSLELPSVAPPVPYTPQLVALGLQHEPKAEIMRRQVKQAMAAVSVARRQRYPDLSLGLEARNYTGDGSFRQEMVTLSFNFPWGNAGKYRSDIERNEAQADAAEFDLADWELSVQQDIYRLTIDVDAARREALLYQEEIIPRSEQALVSARAAWEAGRRTLREVLEGRRMLLDARLRYARGVAEQYQVLSDLILCCGLGDFESLQMIGIDLSAPAPQPSSKP